MRGCWSSPRPGGLNTQSNTTRIETPSHWMSVTAQAPVWIPNPIQQGLKRFSGGGCSSARSGLNTQSNTTRIETFPAGTRLVQGERLNTQSNTTRIETQRCRPSHPGSSQFEYPIQYNKDWNTTRHSRSGLHFRSLNTQSNTTRIETKRIKSILWAMLQSLNTQSNTTRIETWCK